MSATGERTQLLDVVRGFALLGVFAMNVEFFTRPLHEISAGLQADLGGVDYAAGLFVHALVQGKFWLLFALLFGAGFALLERRTGDSFFAVHYRRTLSLGLIGVLHSVFVWAGDVLLTYALVALLLPAFRHTTTAHLARWSALLFGVPVLLMILGALNALQDGGVRAAPMPLMQATPQSYADATAQRFSDTVSSLSTLPVFGVMVLGVFLAGAWFVRSNMLFNHREHARAWRALLALLPIGLSIAAVSMALSLQFVGSPTGSLAASVMLAASPCLALGYLASIVILVQRGGLVARGLSFLAPAGRMALTNYLLQSVVGVVVFHDYALGLTLSRAEQCALVIVVFAVQVVGSRLWFATGFKHGPMESAWRTVTYWSTGDTWCALERPSVSPAREVVTVDPT